ncbi:uncharacterized protein [Watersipora subatra]|uniref:uncharacterized protein n=1 Tax=Watersipora subatra TaxID=2589382 RepID=UPI00355BDAAA
MSWRQTLDLICYLTLTLILLSRQVSSENGKHTNSIHQNLSSSAQLTVDKLATESESFSSMGESQATQKIIVEQGKTNPELSGTFQAYQKPTKVPYNNFLADSSTARLIYDSDQVTTTSTNSSKEGLNSALLFSPSKYNAEWLDDSESNFTDFNNSLTTHNATDYEKNISYIEETTSWRDSYTSTSSLMVTSPVTAPADETKVTAAESTSNKDVPEDKRQQPSLSLRSLFQAGHSGASFNNRWNVKFTDKEYWVGNL